MGAGGGVRQTLNSFLSSLLIVLCVSQSICRKCKIVGLPCDLAVHVKVGDDYKIVCILQAWEIKCLATTVRQQLPLVAVLPFFLVYSLPASSFTPDPSSFFDFA